MSNTRSPFKTSDSSGSGNNHYNDSALKAIDDNSVFGRYYVKICETMNSNNVPRDRIPTLAHFMSMAFACIDEVRMEKWITGYIENEKTEIPEEDE